MKKTWILALLVVTLLALPLLAACGDEEETTTTAAGATATTAAAADTTTTAGAATTTSAATGGGDQYGGVLRVRIGDAVDAPLGDPLQNDYPGNERVYLALEPLMWPGENPGEYDYVLATGFTLAPDKSYYDITLREGVTFHDGAPCDATAVKWNLDRVLAAEVPQLRTVTSVDVIDASTIRINLSAWNNEFLNDLMCAHSLIISPTAYEQMGADAAMLNPVGTGPFVFKEIRNNQTLVFEKNPSYWDQGLPYLDGIELEFIPDQQVGQAALENGEIDINSMCDHLIAKQLESDADYRVFPTAGTSCLMLFMNTTDPNSVWSDVRMRQALEYATDKETVISTVGSPYYEARYHIIPGLEQVADLSSIAPRTYDPEKAKALIEETGNAGLAFNFYINTFFASNSWDKNEYLAWQQAWADVGLNVNIEIVEFAKAIEIGMSPLPGNDIMSTIVLGNPLDPIQAVLNYLQEGTISFVGVQRPAEWPALIDQALQTEDAAEKLSLLAEIDKIAYDQAMVIPIHAGCAVNIATAKVHDPGCSVSIGWYPLKYTWIEQ